MQPSVCPKPLCNHSFSLTGLGFSLIGELRHNTAVTDLLITMTVPAARTNGVDLSLISTSLLRFSSANGADVFTPYPESLSIERKNELGQVVQTISFLDSVATTFTP